MFTIVGGGPYCAISFDGATFDDLQFYMDQDGYKLSRLDPNEFLLSEPDRDMQYINLVTRFPLREEICRHLDTNSLDRFSFFCCYVPQLKNIAGGVFLYPEVCIYPSAKIESDVIIHAQTGVAHGSVIGQGSYLSGGVGVAGNVKLGKFCWMGMKAVLLDHLSIADHTTINSRTLVIKDIVEEYSIYNKHVVK